MTIFPCPLGSWVLTDPLYDPKKFGSLYLPDSARNEAPTQGDVVAVGRKLALEINIGDRLLLSYKEFSRDSRVWWDSGSSGYEYIFFHDREIVARLSSDAEVLPRKNQVIIKPDWDQSGVVKSGSLYTIQRLFDSPQPPKIGTVLRIGTGVTNVRPGQKVAIPRTGGFELGVRDTVIYSVDSNDILGILDDAVPDHQAGPDRSRRKAKARLR